MDAMTDTTTDPRAGGSLQGGPLLSAISNEIVGVYRRHYGRGPTRARTVMVEDVVLCRMLDPYTTSERTLIARGRVEEVFAVRHAFQMEMRDEFVEIVERLVGRRVNAFLSDCHVEPDLVTEMFFLEDGDPPEDPQAGLTPMGEESAR
jgi:uncharacterized protein YbcI